MLFLSQIFSNFDFYWLIFEFSNTSYDSVINSLSLSNVLNVSSTLIFLFLNSISTNMLNSLVISSKFLLCMALLIFARGGMPSFRFDYLTKLGWMSFLSLVLLAFLLEIFMMNTF